jgi:serine/threonine-protein kinase
MPAFQADTFPGICAAIVADDPADIRTLRSDVPEALIAVILRCLDKDPRRRYPTVADLIQALRPFAPRGASTMPTLPAPRPSSPQASVSSDAATVSVTTSDRSRRTLSAPEIRVRPALLSPDSFAASHPGVSASGPRQPAAGRRSRLGGLLAGAFVLGLGAAVAVVLLRNTDTPAPAETQRAAFKLTIESTPLGAQVVESGRVIGATPLTLSIDRSSVASAPRSFVVRHSGYFPYSLQQGSSDEDVRFVAALVPEPSVTEEPAPAPSAAPPVEVAPPAAVRRPSRSAKPVTPKPVTPKPATPKPATPKPATPKPAAAETQPAPSLDIRMQR